MATVHTLLPSPEPHVLVNVVQTPRWLSGVQAALETANSHAGDSQESGDHYRWAGFRTERKMRLSEAAAPGSDKPDAGGVREPTAPSHPLPDPPPPATSLVHKLKTLKTAMHSINPALIVHDAFPGSPSTAHLPHQDTHSLETELTPTLFPQLGSPHDPLAHDARSPCRDSKQSPSAPMAPRPCLACLLRRADGLSAAPAGSGTHRKSGNRTRVWWS